MPKINVEVNSPIDSAKSFEKIKAFLSGDNFLKSFDPKISSTFDESAKKCHIQGGQFKATLQISEKDSHSCLINVEIDVPMALALFKGQIKDNLEKNLKKILV